MPWTYTGLTLTGGVAVEPFVDHVGTGSPGPYVKEHGLGTQNFDARIFRNAGHPDNNGSGAEVFAAVVPVDDNTVSVEPVVTWAQAQMRLVIWPVGGDIPFGLPINAPATGFTLTAHVPTIEVGGQINPPAAAFTLTAHVPTVEVPAAATIQFVSAAGVKNTSTITVPTHQTGDLLLIAAYRDGFVTPPALPAGWTAIVDGGADSNAMRVGYKVAASSSETSGSWTNSTTLVCQVYRNVASVGASAQGGGTTDPVVIPAVTLQDSDGSSWVAAFAGHRSGANSLQSAPSGLTYRAGYEGSGTEQDQAGYDTNAGVTSFTAKNVAYATTSGWRTAAVELRT